MTTMEKSK